MNRRKFIKSAFAIAALIPFISWKQEKYKIFGVDKATGKDQTIFQIYQSQGTTAISLGEYAKLMGYNNFPVATHNCRCVLEFERKL